MSLNIGKLYLITHSIFLTMKKKINVHSEMSKSLWFKLVDDYLSNYNNKHSKTILNLN